MSLFPSNMIAAGLNPTLTMFPNLARHAIPPYTNCDPSEALAVEQAIKNELMAAGISVVGPHDWGPSEVPSRYRGEVCCWSFTRAWYYWIAEGPGIPVDKAEELHVRYGTCVRVNGDCTCPSPTAQNHGFAIGLYHIDAQEGLNAFVATLKSIYKE